MTMPHLQNCDHLHNGWCLRCVKKLGDENIRLTQLLEKVSELTLDEEVDYAADGFIAKKLIVEGDKLEPWLEVMDEVQMWNRERKETP